ncbi:YDG domain-containing protein, partial [Niveibacterium sp. 24ML]|uniref:YDG domain-containing protein n=1 Tax=Niveibacterium sp. 24ML TaxID=2985512 RepID=UPI00226DD4A1
ISASGKTYDGTTAATTAGSLAGVVAGDAVALDTTGAFNDKNAGTGKTVAVSAVLSGADAGNYTLSHNATTSADIAQATLVYVAEPVSGFVGLPPSLSGTVTGFVSGDTLANATAGTMVWLSSGSAATEPGRYAVTGDGLSATNYVFAQAAGNATALTLQAGSSPPSLVSITSQLDVSQLRSPSAPGTTIPTGRQTAPGTVLISTSAGPVLTLADASLDNVEQLLAMAPTAAGEASGDAESRFAPSDEERAAQSANTILSLRVEDGGVRLPAGRVSFK